MYKYLGIFSCLLLVSGCTDVRHKLGLEFEAPDEFTVYNRAPLTVPPEYSLRPPTPGSAPTQEGTVKSSAQQILSNGVVAAPRAASDTPGKAAFLDAASVTHAESDIREKVDADIAVETPQNKSVVQEMLFWQKKEPSAKTLNPHDEKKRLQSGSAIPGAAHDAHKEAPEPSEKTPTQAPQPPAPIMDDSRPMAPEEWLDDEEVPAASHKNG